jgi:4-amino-4-deoxy-L-arabinose transferase-like glycosyltransferase
MRMTNKTMKKNITITILVAITALSLFLNNYKRDIVPPCFNADEAAFSYNAYSILKTGKDEYGTFLPLRLKSFGDYKMPLYSYLSVPIIGLFGLNETSARGLNILLSILFPITIYLFSKQLFKRDDGALVSAFLISTSLGLNILGRHTHEAYLSTYLTILTAYLLLKVKEKYSLAHIIGFLVSSLFLLFSYHPGRIFAGYLFGCLLIYTISDHIAKKPRNPMM